jgi:hypothetical protein
MAQCKGKKPDGTQCRMQKAMPHGFCYSHRKQVGVPRKKNNYLKTSFASEFTSQQRRDSFSTKFKKEAQYC